MPTEIFDFTGAEGQRLSGRLDLPVGEARAHALFAHCFTCGKGSLAAVRIARALNALGIGVLRFDFTGLGESEGEFAASTFSGSVADLVAAAAEMTRRGYPPTLLVGHSLGGAAALAAVHDLPEIKAVATIGAPFDVTHLTRLFTEDLPELEAKGEVRVDLGGRPFTIRKAFLDDLRAQDQGRRIAALHRALLILHSPLDEQVSVEQATRIFLAARHPKSFISLDTADHLLIRQADADYAAQVIAAWAGRYLPEPPVTAEDDGWVTAESTGRGNYQMLVAAGPARFLADEPVSVGGEATGPSPYGLLSAALAACTAMTLRLYAGQKGWPLGQVAVRAGHSRQPDEAIPDVFSREITLSGPLDAEQHEGLLRIADRCPVHQTLKRGSRIETKEAGQPPPVPDPEPPEQHAWDMARIGEGAD